MIDLELAYQSLSPIFGMIMKKDREKRRG